MGDDPKRGYGVAAGWHFFLSCAKDDLSWGAWLAWELESAGYHVLFHGWDVVPGSNTSTHIQDGLVNAERTIIVLSAAHLRTLDDSPGWQAAIAADPSAADRRVVPVRIEECDLPGLLSRLAPINLFGLAEDDARATLLTRVRHTIDGRAKPAFAPPFPRRSEPAAPPRVQPAFPTAAHIASHPPGAGTTSHDEADVGAEPGSPVPARSDRTPTGTTMTARLDDDPSASADPQRPTRPGATGTPAPCTATEADTTTDAEADSATEA
ncbi:toll/interleukin-1 receptor domain-containing protein, partial [Frankia canadensis]|uniref:toll/interleukin-1 receptor domain-containing protein n=1 Tax=Frankia canadensis TaxID=1836972 RepID=UPI00105429B8